MINALPQPCPMPECTGYMIFAPKVSAEFVYHFSADTECVTFVTVRCAVIAECESCGFNEVLNEESKNCTFDQVFLSEDEASAEPSAEFLAEIEEMNRFAEQEAAYVE